MTPQTLLEAIAAAINSSPEFDAGDIITETLDAEGVNSSLRQPVVTVELVSAVRSDQHNTDRIGFILNDGGDRIGQIFEADFVADVQIDVYLAAGHASLNAGELGGQLQRALFTFDDAMIGKSLPDPDGSGTVDSITEFIVGDGERADDLSGPGIRRFRQDISVRFSDRVETTDPTVEVVDTPRSGEATGDDNDADDVAVEYLVP